MSVPPWPRRSPTTSTPTCRRRRLLSALRGKDVLLVFVESYGRVALEGLPTSAQLRDTVDADSERLEAAGYHSRSAYLTSPTFGAMSWLAHSTLQSGLWIDNQGTYDLLLGRDRLTLSSAFGKAGWRSVGMIPADTEPWPEGERFYHWEAPARLHEHGVRGAALRLRPDARPVRAGVVPAARARPAGQQTDDGR